MEPITFEEYAAAYRRFVACLHETGVGIVEYGLDPEHQTFSYATEGGDPEVERETGRIPSDDCYDEHFADADMRWQLQQQEPGAEAEFKRALAFFAERGVEDFPPEYIESGSIGALISHASSILGDGVVHEYSQFEEGSEVRRRIAGLETTPAPEPWTLLVEQAVSHLLAVGFSTEGTKLLVVGGDGRSVVDLATGETVAVDADPNSDAHLSASRQQCNGLGPLSGELVAISGFFGGGLARCTADGWWLIRCAIEWPAERVILQAPDANMYNSFKGLTQLPGSMGEVRAAGFSPDGRRIVLATTSGIRIWQRGPISDR